MSLRKVQFRYLWFRLVEARTVILIAALIAGGFTALLLFMVTRPGPSGDLYWHPAATESHTICNIYGEATVCFPATEGIEKYRREQKARREAGPGD